MAVKVKVGQTKNVRLVATSEKRAVIDPNSVTLGVDTVGEYVRAIDAGAGIVVVPEANVESANLVISHENTSDLANTENSTLQFIQNATLDQFGHLTGLTSGTLDSNTFIIENDIIKTKQIQFGNTAIEVGGNSDEITGLTSLEVGSFTLSGNTISSTANNVVFETTQPLGTFDFGTRRLVNVDNQIDDKDVVNKRYLEFEIDRVETTIKVFDDPVLETDATNKRYVDNIAKGLRVRPAALAATTEDLNGTFEVGNTT